MSSGMPVGMGTGRPDGLGSDVCSPEQLALVDKTEHVQKISDENNEMWNAFSGATKGPTRHMFIKLQEFCQMYAL